MGKRGPRSRLGGRKAPIVFRPDEETLVALAQDLEALRAVRSRASMADVLRSWARSSNRERFVSHEARLQLELGGLKDALRQAQERARAAEDLVNGFRDRATAEQQRDIDAAVRAITTNPDVARHVQDLVKLEAAGLVATSSYPLLQRARRNVPSWEALFQRRDAP